MINEHHIRGEKNTGFEAYGNKGPFECGNCKYFHPQFGDMGGCDQTEMIIYSREPRLGQNAVLVHAEDCCEYVERVGKRDPGLTPEI